MTLGILLSAVSLVLLCATMALSASLLAAVVGWAAWIAALWTGYTFGRG